LNSRWDCSTQKNREKNKNRGKISRVKIDSVAC